MESFLSPMPMLKRRLPPALTLHPNAFSTPKPADLLTSYPLKERQQLFDLDFGDDDDIDVSPVKKVDQPKISWSPQIKSLACPRPQRFGWLPNASLSEAAKLSDSTLVVKKRPSVKPRSEAVGSGKQAETSLGKPPLLTAEGISAEPTSAGSANAAAADQPEIDLVGHDKTTEIALEKISECSSNTEWIEPLKPESVSEKSNLDASDSEPTKSCKSKKAQPLISEFLFKEWSSDKKG